LVDYYIVFVFGTNSIELRYYCMCILVVAGTDATKYREEVKRRWYEIGQDLNRWKKYTNYFCYPYKEQNIDSIATKTEKYLYNYVLINNVSLNNKWS